MVELEKLFNLRAIKWLLISMLAVAIVLLTLTNIVNVLESTSIDQIRWLYIRDWVFFEENFTLSLLYYIAFILAMVGGVIYYRLVKKLIEISKAREQKSSLRELLVKTMTYLGIGMIIEGFYIVFRSDFRGAYEVLFQFYITLDSLAMVIFMAIGFTIFMDKQVLEKKSMAIFTFVLSFVIAIVGFIMMLLYGLYIENFGIGMVIAVGLMLIESLLMATIAVKIVIIRKKVEEEKKALGNIALMLFFIILSIFMLIACGLTVTTAVLLNRIFRVIRIVLLLGVGYLAYPAFIEPALKIKT